MTVPEPEPEPELEPVEVSSSSAPPVVVKLATVWVVRVRVLVVDPSTTAVVMTRPLVVKTAVVLSSRNVAVPVSTEDVTLVLVTGSLFVTVTVSDIVVGTTEAELDGDGQLAAAMRGKY